MLVMYKERLVRVDCKWTDYTTTPRLAPDDLTLKADTVPDDLTLKTYSVRLLQTL
jgi:hypothetical protein